MVHQPALNPCAKKQSGDDPQQGPFACTEAGVSCTFHDLRHVAGTLNAAAGATIKEAMARLGHASPVAALRYQHAVAARDAVIAGGGSSGPAAEFT